MSRKFKCANINRIEVEVFVIRNYTNQLDFCRKNDVNYGTFKKWMAGDHTMPGFGDRIISIIKDYNYSLETIIINKELENYL